MRLDLLITGVFVAATFVSPMRGESLILQGTATDTGFYTKACGGPTDVKFTDLKITSPSTWAAVRQNPASLGFGSFTSAVAITCENQSLAFGPFNAIGGDGMLRVPIREIGLCIFNSA